MPKLSEDLFAVPEGEIHPRWFHAGEEVHGAIADAAKAQHKLVQEAKKPPARKAMKAPENK